MRIVRPIKRRRLAPLALAGLVVGVVALAAAGGAPAQDLQSQLDQKRAQLDNAKSQEGVLSTTIQRYSDQIDTLAGQVATLRNREAAVQADLDAAAVELRQDKRRLTELRVRLAHSLKVLRLRLVGIYRSSAPDVLSVILDSKGFDDLISRYQYLRNIEDQDSKIVGRVRDLRDEAHATVERVRALRNELAAKRDELARTRAELESREAALNAARGRKRDALAQVQATADHLEGDISHIQGQIQAQLQAAEAASPTPPLPAGPVQGESSSGFIWPVNGPVQDDQRRLRVPPGDRHRRPERHPDPRGRGRDRRPRAVRGRERGLRQLHLHRAWRQPLDLLRPPAELRRLAGRLGLPGPGDRLQRLHRLLLRAPSALRGPGQRHARRPDGLPLGHRRWVIAGAKRDSCRGDRRPGGCKCGEKSVKRAKGFPRACRY